MLEWMYILEEIHMWMQILAKMFAPISAIVVRNLQQGGSHMKIKSVRK